MAEDGGGGNGIVSCAFTWGHGTRFLESVKVGKTGGSTTPPIPMSQPNHQGMRASRLAPALLSIPSYRDCRSSRTRLPAWHSMSSTLNATFSVGTRSPNPWSSLPEPCPALTSRAGHRCTRDGRTPNWCPETARLGISVVARSQKRGRSTALGELRWAGATLRNTPETGDRLRAAMSAASRMACLTSRTILAIS